MDDEPGKEEAGAAVSCSFYHQEAAQNKSAIVLGKGEISFRAPEYEARYGESKGGNKKRESRQRGRRRRWQCRLGRVRLLQAANLGAKAKVEAFLKHF